MWFTRIKYFSLMLRSGFRLLLIIFRALSMLAEWRRLTKPLSKIEQSKWNPVYNRIINTSPLHTTILSHSSLFISLSLSLSLSPSLSYTDAQTRTHTHIHVSNRIMLNLYNIKQQTIQHLLILWHNISPQTTEHF